AERVYARAGGSVSAGQPVWGAGRAGNHSAGALLARPAAGRAEEYADRAVALLRQAVAGGYRNLAGLQADEELEAVRGHAGYRALLSEAGLRRVYASVWRDDATREAVGLQGLSGARHLQRCRELAALGYRP